MKFLSFGNFAVKKLVASYLLDWLAFRFEIRKMLQAFLESCVRRTRSGRHNRGFYNLQLRSAFIVKSRQDQNSSVEVAL
jgi:hypothetical protein